MQTKYKPGTKIRWILTGDIGVVASEQQVIEAWGSVRVAASDNNRVWAFWDGKDKPTHLALTDVELIISIIKRNLPDWW